MFVGFQLSLSSRSELDLTRLSKMGFSSSDIRAWFSLFVQILKPYELEHRNERQFSITYHFALGNTVIGDKSQAEL